MNAMIYSKKRKIFKTPYQNLQRYPKTVPKSAPSKCRTGRDGRIHFDFPDFNKLPTLKSITEQDCRTRELASFTKEILINKFQIHQDIIHMTPISAADYKFPFNDNQNQSTKITDFIFNEDDAFADNYNVEANEIISKPNNDQDMLFDDWCDIDSNPAFDNQLRHNIKSTSSNTPYG